MDAAIINNVNVDDISTYSYETVVPPTLEDLQTDVEKLEHYWAEIDMTYSQFKNDIDRNKTEIAANALAIHNIQDCSNCCKLKTKILELSVKCAEHDEQLSLLRKVIKKKDNRIKVELDALNKKFSGLRDEINKVEKDDNDKTLN